MTQEQTNMDNECLIPAWTPNCPGRTKDDMDDIRHIIQSVVEGARMLAQITDRESSGKRFNAGRINMKENGESDKYAKVSVKCCCGEVVHVVCVDATISLISPIICPKCGQEITVRF